jgi:hypothetical protein
MTNYSLNSNWRKKEFVRIDLENQAIASRLQIQKSEFDRTKFASDYKQTKRYKKLIRRVEPAASTFATPKASVTKVTIIAKNPKVELEKQFVTLSERIKAHERAKSMFNKEI